MKQKTLKIAILVLILITTGLLITNLYLKKKTSFAYQTSDLSNIHALMLETEEGVFVKSGSNSFPSSDEYYFDEDNSYCVNGSLLTYIKNKISYDAAGPDKCFVYFKKLENLPINPKDRILSLNGGKKSIESKGNPNFSTVATTDEGMYAMADDYGTSYYFRGAVSNNWVKFGKEGSADIYWRIVRINGDGSIRMIYSGTTAPTEGTKTVMTGSHTQIGTSAFNSNYNSGEYIGYMYTMGEHRGSGTSSTIKTYIDNWYNTNLKTNYETYIQDTIYCNDRTFYTTTSGGTPATPVGLPGSTIYSNAYVRLITNKSPNLKCAHKDDSFTVRDTTKGNGKLTNPIGLITADEAWIAGGINANNNSYYLYTNSHYWTLSPYIVGTSHAFGFVVNSSGLVYYYSVRNTRGARAAVSLIPNSLNEGTGEWNNPYRIE